MERGMAITVIASVIATRVCVCREYVFHGNNWTRIGCVICVSVRAVFDKYRVITR